MRLVPLVSWLVVATTSLVPALVFAAPDAGVAVVRTAAWSPGDSAREGAGEFLVLLEAARLQRTTRASGIVAVGDRNGMLQSGGERALRRLALTGVVVARIARDGEVASTPDGLFLDAGRLDEDATRRVLLRGLELHGSPPVVANPEQPAEPELAAIRAHLKVFQALFAGEDRALVAVR